MAVTVTFDLPKAVRLEKGNKSGLSVISGTIAFDNSYPTGGESITAITGKFQTCLQVICDNFGGFLTTFDKTNSKLLVYQATDAVAGTRAEAANAADLSGITAMRFIAYGLL